MGLRQVSVVAILLGIIGCASPTSYEQAQSVPESRGTPASGTSGALSVGGVVSFDPTADPSLVMCLDHLSRYCRDTGGTQLCADGDSCAFWADRSGNGYHAKALPGKNKPVYRTSVLGGVAGLAWSGTTGWNGLGQVLTLGKPAALSALQSTSFTLVTAVTYHTGSGFVLQKAADASGGVFGISVFDSVVGQYNAINKGVPVTPDEFVTFCASFDPSKTEVGGVRRFYQNGAPRRTGGGTADETCAIEIGSMDGYYSWNGRILAVMLFSRTLSAAEILETDQYLRTVYGQPWQGDSSPFFVLWDGNSISADGQLPVMVAEALGITPHAMFNFSWGSKTTANMIQYDPADVDPVAWVLASRNKPIVSVGWEITNELGSGAAAAASAYRNVATYGQARRAQGMKHVAATCLPSVYRDEATRQIANDSVRSRYSLFADGLADVASDPNMGQAGQGADTDYYGDGLHPTLLGKQTLEPYFTNAIDTALGAGTTGVLRR